MLGRAIGIAHCGSADFGAPMNTCRVRADKVTRLASQAANSIHVSPPAPRGVTRSRVRRSRQGVPGSSVGQRRSAPLRAALGRCGWRAVLGWAERFSCGWFERRGLLRVGLKRCIGKERCAEVCSRHSNCSEDCWWGRWQVAERADSRAGWPTSRRRRATFPGHGGKIMSLKRRP
eukprot:COSAG02_NODE_1196_length_13929_cov_17.931039_8_plen_175_part_00